MPKIQVSLMVGMVVFFIHCSQEEPTATAPESLDPLPSWNEGTTKSAIVDFVTLNLV